MNRFYVDEYVDSCEQLTLQKALFFVPAMSRVCC